MNIKITNLNIKIQCSNDISLEPGRVWTVLRTMREEEYMTEFQTNTRNITPTKIQIEGTKLDGLKWI